MAPVSLIKAPTPNSLGIIYKKEDHIKTVISYYPALTNDVIVDFLTLAKGLNKHIVLIDWTQDKVEDCFNPYRNINDYYVIFFGNSLKDVKKEAYSVDLTLGKDTIVNSVPLLDKQFRSYPDEWDLFKSISMVRCYDVNGTYYGDAVQEYARMFADLVKIPIFERKLILGQFNDWLIKKLATFPSVRQNVSSKMARLFKAFLTTGQINTKNQLKDKISSAQSEMTSHYTAIQRLEKNISETGIVLRSLVRKFSGFNSEFPDDKLTEIFDSFSKNKMYNKFVFHDTYIEAMTDEIWCESYGKKYYIGKFQVIIYLNGTVKMHNTVSEKRYDDNDHPHICAGIPCLGNIKEIVPKMIYNGDFIGLLNLLHQFLITYNEKGPYSALEVGWGTAEDWCRRCEHPKLNCQCKNCNECGEDEEHCTCSRCPRHGELMDNVDCDSCDYWKHENKDEDDEPIGDRSCTY